MLFQFLAVHQQPHQAQMLLKGSRRETVSILLEQRDILGISESWVIYIALDSSSAFHQS